MNTTSSFHGLRAKAPRVGGLFPNSEIDRSFVDRFYEMECMPEFDGLTPMGFTDSGEPFNHDDFNRSKLYEIAQLASNYFVYDPRPSADANLRSILSLVSTLLSSPESHCRGFILPGELIAGLYIGGIESYMDTEAEGGVMFCLDAGKAFDANSYIDNDHGFENILRPRTRLQRDLC